MTPTDWKKNVHSADVRIELYLNGSVFNVAQLGRDFLILRDPFDHPPADAEISMSIDGHEDRWAVRLAEGIQAGQRKTSISRRGGSNGSTV